MKDDVAWIFCLGTFGELLGLSVESRLSSLYVRYTRPA